MSDAPERAWPLPPPRPSRRTLLGGGLAALSFGALRGRAAASPLAQLARGLARSGADAARPFLALEKPAGPLTIGGFPFLRGYEGDPWSQQTVPFHSPEGVFPGDLPPAPSEEVELCIVGGGLSGLATAWLLREHAPVLLELRSRFGGVSQGLHHDGLWLSQGGAYFIVPDEGSRLERFYRELRLDEVWRLNQAGDDPVELEGVLRRDFWDGLGTAGVDALAFQRYATIVRKFAEQTYPDIPLAGDPSERWILELDRSSLKKDLEQRMGGPLPPLLAAAIQGYCYSSFNAGWESISAAAGWNFLAAEEYGRLVCPGGNAWVSDTLWQRLREHYGVGASGRLRSDARVVDVRPVRDGRIQVSWRVADGSHRSLLARRVVMACSKHVCKHVLHRLMQDDPARMDAMHQVLTTSYLVANVLLDRPLGSGGYDVFLLGDGMLEMLGDDPDSGRRPIDLIDGGYATPKAARGAMTLYWPMPSPESMFHVLAEDSFEAHSARLVPELERVLRILNLPRESVRGVRLTRWGHAMPVARTGFLADGVPAILRSPWHEHVWFVNQDNWALPAFETCLLEAFDLAPRVAAGL